MAKADHAPGNETAAFIDGATLAQVSQLFDIGPGDVYPWAWQNVIEVTCLLIGTDHLYLTPGPVPIQTSPGLMNSVEGGLLGTGSIRRLRVDQEVRGHALKSTKSWATRNTAQLRTHCDEIKAD